MFWMASFELFLKLLKEANNQAKIPIKPSPKDTKAWCDYFLAKVTIAQEKRRVISPFF